VILVVVFALGNMRRPRYLAASYPMLSVLMAAMLLNIGPLKAAPAWFNQTIKVAAVFVSMLGVGLLLAGISTDWRLTAGGGVLVIVGISGWLTTCASSETPRWIWMAGVPVILFGIFGACIRPAFSPSPLARAAEILTGSEAAGATAFTWQVTDSAEGQLRLLVGGKLTFKTLDAAGAEPDFTVANTVITTSPNQLSLEGTGYKLREITVTNKALAASWLGRFAAKHFADSKERAGASYWIAVKSPRGQP
jgi:hypothetical protein